MSIGSWWLFLESIMHGAVKAYKKKGKTFAVFPGNTFLILAAVKQQAEFFFLSGSHSREGFRFCYVTAQSIDFSSRPLSPRNKQLGGGSVNSRSSARVESPPFVMDRILYDDSCGSSLMIKNRLFLAHKNLA
jgi:hypothetical protein